MTHTTDSQTVRRSRAKRQLAKWSKLAERHADLPETADERHEREQSAWLRRNQL